MSVRNKILNSGNPEKIEKFLNGIQSQVGSWNCPKEMDLIRLNRGSTRIHLRDHLVMAVK
jgi:hypothetical protein